LVAGFDIVDWYDPYGNKISTLSPGSGNWINGLAFNRNNQKLYAIVSNSVGVFDSFGNWMGYFGSSYDSPSSILFDKNGYVYVGQSNTPDPILKFDPTGNTFINFSLYKYTWEAWPMDLASDQCTLYYAFSKESAIKRFDLCNNTPLPNLTWELSPGYSASGIRLLSDGSILIATNIEIRRLNIATGKLLQTYNLPDTGSWAEISLDPDGKSFWSTSGAGVYKFDITSGDMLMTFDAGSDGFVSGIAIVDELRAALPIIPTIPPTVPTPIPPTVPTPIPPTVPTPIPPTVQTPIPLTTPPAIPTTSVPENTPIPTDIQPPAPVITESPPVEPSGNTSLFWLVLIIGALAIGTVALIVRGTRVKPPHDNNSLRPQATRARAQGHPEAGEQTIIPSSDLPTPQIRLRFDQGITDYHIENQESDKGE
jgi:hypothetical protein